MKIIDPIINSKINLTKNSSLFYISFRNKSAFSSVENAVKSVEFTLEKARSAHTFWIKQICEVTLLSTVNHGTKKSGYSAEVLEAKMKKGEAIIAFASDGRWAGFSFISTWENAKYVSNSELIMAPEFRDTGLEKKMERKIFELSIEKYPNASII